jgi:hypothetical protein
MRYLYDDKGNWEFSVMCNQDPPITLTPEAPATTGAFHAQIKPKYSHPQQSKVSHFFNSTDTSIPSTQLPNTLLPIPITDAIGSPKSHCYLMPLLRDLIEAYVKRKR